MLPNSHTLAGIVSAETGLDFSGREGRDPDGTRWLELYPAEHIPSQTFTIRTQLGWRRLDVDFRPGNFAGELLEAMQTADTSGRQIFLSVLETCRTEEAEVILTINGMPRQLDDVSIWEFSWKSMGLSVKRGMLAFNEGNADGDLKLISLWTGRTVAAVMALMPLEIDGQSNTLVNEALELSGLPEGSKVRVEVNRYERDRRNRMAALAIHGYTCKACELDLGLQYGGAATGLIEVHHITPISQLGAGYVIDPKSDLVPLCPNCHAVTHRRSPPYSLEDLKQMLEAQKHS